MPDYAALKAEILTPTYNGSNDAQCANYLNTTTVSSTQTAGFVPSYSVLNACDITELGNLTQLQVSRLTLLLTPGTVNTQSTNVRQALANIFPTNGATIQNLLALRTMTITQSRADFLNLGFGRPLDGADILRARNS